ncbi:MAG TPA: glycosyltransferase family 39 protein, partial [Anaerolineae bacterium]|nr:glycosyltransferase family 39 protein [Anaerolineae bacterium]
MRRWWPRPTVALSLIVAVYLSLAVSYSVVVPIGRGADEWAHYWYAQFIAQNGRLPLSPAERETAGYKSDWPPLYHLLTAGLTGWIETAGPPTFKYRADHVRRQLIPAQGSEAILHTEDELFPWQQEILVWHLGRFLSILFSAGTVVVTYFIAREVMNELRVASDEWLPVPPPPPLDPQSSNPPTLHPFDFAQGQPANLPPFQSSNLPTFMALVAAIVLAFNPRFLFTGMLFNYDSLTLFLSALFLWLVIRIVRGYSSSWSFWGLGGLAGLALVTKYLAAPLLLVIIGVSWLKPGQKIGEAGKSRRSEAGQALRPTFHVPRPFLTALLAYSLLISPWFAYLLINFNEVERYGPVLGTLAPLLRGDGSDRTVEQLFAWLSGGQAPPPDYIEQQRYSAWEIIWHLPLTFWGNPVAQPYPLTWFVVVMSLLTVAAGVGLGLGWRSLDRSGQRLLGLLILYCLLPVPFMLVRLFGARDALEAVQGRHLLFLAGPAFAILFVWGLLVVTRYLSAIRPSFYVLRFTFFLVPALLLTGAIGQLGFMQRAYAPPLPVQTTAYRPAEPAEVALDLPGGAKLIDYRWAPAGSSLHVELFWQGGSTWAPADYLTELALVDAQGETLSSWRAYQTQARYPTRAWEPGDTIRDDAWLPLPGLPPGDYEVRLRLLHQTEPVTDWQSLGAYSLTQSTNPVDTPQFWYNGQLLSRPPRLHERETLQVAPAPLASTSYQLLDPTGQPRSPLALDPTTPSFIIAPDWPPGPYALATEPTRPLFYVAENGRTFQMPAMSHSLDVIFDGK